MPELNAGEQYEAERRRQRRFMLGLVLMAIAGAVALVAVAYLKAR